MESWTSRHYTPTGAGVLVLGHGFPLGTTSRLAARREHYQPVAPPHAAVASVALIDASAEWVRRIRGLTG